MGITMTRITQITTVITALTIMIGFTAIPNVSAHSEDNPQKWFASKTQSLCYADTGISYLKFDGSTPNTAAAKTQIRLGQSQMSDNTNMNLSETTSCTGYKNWVTSFYDSNTSLAAYATALFTTSGTEYKLIYFNNNQYEYWVTNGNCSSTTLDLSNISNHEFGHFAGMMHQTDGSTGHTMMRDPCTSDNSSIKSADISFVNPHYP